MTSTLARRQRSRRHRRLPVAPRRGFTLVSMLVAIILLTVGLSALSGANASTIRLQTLAQNRTNAIAIARAYLEQLRTRDPRLVVSEATVQLNAQGVTTGSNLSYSRTVTVIEQRQNLVQVEVLVEYPQAQQPVRLITLLFRGNGLSGAP